MPLHDWTRVGDGICHDFHLAWIAEFRRRLNGGLLPNDYYALAEQVVGGGNPDAIALRAPDSAPRRTRPGGAVLTAPPLTRVVAHAPRERYTALQRRMIIRHASDDRIVAIIEIVSAGNKAGEHPFRMLLDKSLAALAKGVHLALLDVHPPTPRDPNGFHAALWKELAGEDYSPPSWANRTLAAYSAGPTKIAYIEPMQLGQTFPDLPLFSHPRRRRLRQLAGRTDLQRRL